MKQAEHSLRRKIEQKLKDAVFSKTEYLTLRGKSEGFLCEEHSSVMQRLRVFLQALEANGEDPRLPVMAKGRNEDEKLLRRELDVHKQKLDEAVCVLAAEIMPEHVKDVFLLIGGDAKASSQSEAALRLAQLASALLNQSPELHKQQQQQQQRQKRTPTTRMTTVLMTMTFIIKIAQDNPCSPYLVSGSCPLSGSRHQNVGLLLHPKRCTSEKPGTKLIFLLTFLC